MPTDVSDALKTEIQWAQAILSGREYPVVIELGAHHGEDSGVLYDACRPAPGVYLAVEADARNIPCLQKHMANRKVAQIIHAAICDRTGVVNLYLADGNWQTGLGTGSSSIRRPTKHLETWPEITFSETVAVSGYKLDTLGALHGLFYGDVVDLIWCDIQGAERDMIAGGRQVLARTQWLLIEADREAYYEGAATRDEMPGLLPGWELVTEWPEDGNMLFRNVRLERLCD